LDPRADLVGGFGYRVGVLCFVIATSTGKVKHYEKLLMVLSIVWLGASSFAQGLVKFLNSSSTLISAPVAGGFSLGTIQPYSTAIYYFALLTAPIGTSDPSAFTFAGIYATNTATTTGGRIMGGTANGVPVNGWAAGESRAFEVVGWSSDGGTVFNPGWLTYSVNVPALFGRSGIGQGLAGGTDSNGASIPPLALFGAAPSISSGFVLGVPEPTTCALAGFAGLCLMLLRLQRGTFR
jgi:hypothetical protein